MSEQPTQDNELRQLVADWLAKQEAAGAPAPDPRKKHQLLETAADQEALLRQRIARLREHGTDCQERIRILERALSTLDFERYREIQRLFLDPQKLRRSADRLKYLNLDLWLDRKLDLVLQLGLHEQPPLHILELGTGCGHFPFLCSLFGHRVWASDRQASSRFKGRSHVDLYELVCTFLGVDRHDLTITAQRALPRFDVRFDMVTALMVKFDRPSAGEHWTPDDWDFFLTDLATNATSPDARVFLQLNRPSVTEPIFTRMENRGARVDRSRCQVWFDGLEALRRKSTASDGAGSARRPSCEFS
jgi:hypothetical protein